MLPVAREAWIEASSRFVGNPSSPHRLGDRADRALNEAREKLADWMGCRVHEVMWTGGATESNNTAIAHLSATRLGLAIVSSIEHPSVLEAVRHHFPNRHLLAPVTSDGLIDLKRFQELMAANAVACVAVVAANNETGVLQPWEETSRICAEYDVPLLCDAAQWIGRLPASSFATVGYVSGCAHKFGGPPGVGFLRCPHDLQPIFRGGLQEEGRRAGTENVPGVLAMIATLAECAATMSESTAMSARLAWKTAFEDEIVKTIPGIQIVGQKADRLWNTVSVIMPEARDCRQRWVVKMDRLGFAVSTGSACASGKEQPSHVLSAMGYSPDQAGRALRFSAGWTTTEADWMQLARGVGEAVAALA